MMTAVRLPKLYLSPCHMISTVVLNLFSVADHPRYDTAYACEGKTLKIECKEGELIHLIRANYGRFSITICNDHGNTDWSVNCMSAKSLRVLHNRYRVWTPGVAFYVAVDRLMVCSSLFAFATCIIVDLFVTYLHT